MGKRLSEWEKENRIKVKAAKKAQRWGVFVWTPENRYPQSSAIDGKLYKSYASATKAADKRGDTVVREVHFPQE